MTIEEKQKRITSLVEELEQLHSKELRYKFYLNGITGRKKEIWEEIEKIRKFS